MLEMFDLEHNKEWQCPKCHQRFSFGRTWFPEKIICGNCGEKIIVGDGIPKSMFPNYKYGKDGYIDDDTLKQIWGSIADSNHIPKGIFRAAIEGMQNDSRED